MQIKLSVIIPIYNAEKYIDECLNSVLSQNIDAMEIICVDDGSTDNSLKILKGYEKKFSTIKVISQKNQHAGIARNKGMEVASGEYLHFLDVDDFLLENVYNDIYVFAKEMQADIIKFKAYAADIEGQYVKNNVYEMKQVDSALFRKKITFAKEGRILANLTPVPWNAWVRRQYIANERIKYNDLVCVNDRSFYIKAVTHANCVALLDKFVVVHRVNNSHSLAGSRRNKDKFINYVKACALVPKLIEDIDERLQQIVYDEELLQFSQDYCFLKQEVQKLFLDEIKNSFLDIFLKNVSDYILEDEHVKILCANVMNMREKKMVLDNYTNAEKNREIIIYGAGNYGKKLFHLLKKMKVIVISFCQTNMVESGQTIENIPVVDLNTLKNHKNELCILIAVADKKVSECIKHSLNNIFLDRAEVYECGDFIRENLCREKKEHYCLTCGSWIDHFEGIGKFGVYYQKHHIIGAGYRDNGVCPICESSDNVRWSYRVMALNTNIFVEKCRTLHITHSQGDEIIKKNIAANELCDYYSYNLFPEKAEHVIDITNIQFVNEYFDYIIINHILECVPDEENAMKELCRVLKPGGKIIISFPICVDQETIEDLTISQDCVRMYGYDYKEKLERYGIKVKAFSPQNELSQEEIKKYGLISDDICMICKKV